MANFTFLNLDEETRKFMIEELNFDIAEGKLYLSNRLNEIGRNNYTTYLIESMNTGNEETFANMLDQNTNFNETESKQNKLSKVPKNASSLLCQSEFNRYYIRAICQKAISEGQEEVTVYRGRESSWTRPESENKIGTRLNASDLLADLRNNIGKSPELFPEINSGLTVKL